MFSREFRTNAPGDSGDSRLIEDDDETSPEQVEDKLWDDIRRCTRDLLLVEPARGNYWGRQRR